MKNRSGWVSNSSSSSFIISAKKDNNLKFMVEMDLSKNVDQKLSTKEEVDKYIISEHGWKDTPLEEVIEDEYIKDVYTDMLQAINNEEIVYVLSGSSDDSDDVTGLYLYNNGVRGFKDINIIDKGD